MMRKRRGATKRAPRNDPRHGSISGRQQGAVRPDVREVAGAAPLRQNGEYQDKGLAPRSNTTRGWDGLVRRTLTELDKIVSRLPEAEREHYYIAQMKEKFGVLTIYVQHPGEANAFYRQDVNERIRVLLAWADEASSTVCEVCGKPGEATTLQLDADCVRRAPRPQGRG